MTPYTLFREGQPKISIIYELYAVILHKGSINSGHYMCCVKHRLGANDEKWILFNDESVQEIQEEDVANKQPYL